MIRSLNKYPCLLLCLLLMACGQQNRDTENPDTENNKTESVEQPVVVNAIPASVEEIKAAYAQTTKKLKEGKLDSLSLKYDCNGERSGMLTYFSEKGKTRLIRHNYSEYSHHEGTEQYFVADNKPYFVHLNNLSWSFVSGKAAEGATKDDITERRLYLVDEKAVLCLEKAYSKQSDSQNNPDPDKVVNKEVDCKPVNELLDKYQRLVAFRDKQNGDCLEK